MSASRMPELQDDGAEHHKRPRSPRTLWTLGVLALLMCAGLVALGTWQVVRLQWKTELIERVTTRVHANPVPAPGPERWPEVSAAADEYRRVQVSGTFLPDKSTRVQAVTEQGSGFWVLTPLRTEREFLVLVNRGFIPAGTALDAIATPAEPVTITGLLRITEPGGAFLRDNDPVADRWTSRDVQAIAAARGLREVAPYFIDAAAAPATGNGITPIGGLTVIAFHNNHLVYALTWYALALMVAGAAVWVARDERRLRAAAATAERIDGRHEDEAWKERSKAARNK